MKFSDFVVPQAIVTDLKATNKEVQSPRWCAA